jgi:hypothetical protein
MPGLDFDIMGGQCANSDEPTETATYNNFGSSSGGGAFGSHSRVVDGKVFCATSIGISSEISTLENAATF